MTRIHLAAPVLIKLSSREYADFLCAVVEGMDVVDRLGAVRTGELDRPREEVKIISAEVIN